MRIVIDAFERKCDQPPYRVTVGFRLICEANGRSAFRYTSVPMADANGKTDDEIIALAWANVKDLAAQDYAAIEALPSIVGNEWMPLTA